jgi:hypothetical protein
MAALAHIESTFPVLAWRAAGISIWPLLRIRWMFSEWARHYTGGDASQPAGSSGRQRLEQLLRGPAAARRADRADGQADGGRIVQRDIVLLSDGISFARLGERWVERFCDPILAGAAKRGLSSALWTPSDQHRSPRFTPSRFIQPAIDRANIAGALQARLGVGDVDLPALDQVTSWLRQRGFGDGSLNVAKIRSDANRVRSIANLYGRMLRCAQPKLAFVVSYYGVEGMAFVLACRTCGIPVVDIQHGVQGEMHPAYSAWPKPLEGVAHALLPDRFWVWSEWENNVICRWSNGTSHAAVVGGNPWMDVWQDTSRWPSAGEALNVARQLRQRADGRKVVLVTLQYGLNAQEQLEPLVALLREAGAGLAFWVRLHPAMLEQRERIREILSSSGCPYDLDLPTDLPLPALLRQVDVHLTHSSSTVIEAAQFGVHSVLTAPFGAEVFGPLLASGMAHFENGNAPILVSKLLRSGATRPGHSDAAPAIGDALDHLLADTMLFPDRRTS